MDIYLHRQSREARETNKRAMVTTNNNYLNDIKMNLDAALNLRYFPSQMVEKQVHPEVEFQDNAHLLMEPIHITKTSEECCLIESSVNSVRISIRVIKSSNLEVLLSHMLARFMQLRADKFEVLRKKPADPSYDYSFLISADHLQVYKKEEIINFVLEFINSISREINELKLHVMNNSRLAANFFVKGASNQPI